MPVSKCVPAIAPARGQPARKHSGSRRWLALCLILGLVAAWRYLRATHLRPGAEAEYATNIYPTFDWESVSQKLCTTYLCCVTHIQIIPSTTLQWAACYGNKECARFAVRVSFFHAMTSVLTYS
jgi:hypothetical protein